MGSRFSALRCTVYGLCLLSWYGLMCVPTPAGSASTPQAQDSAAQKKAEASQRKNSQRETITIATTHVLLLTNGAKIPCTVLKETPSGVKCGLSPYGTFTVERSRIAQIRTEPGQLVYRRAKRQQRHRPAPRQPPRPAGEETSKQPSERLKPPAVPPEKQKQLLRWLYHLNSANPKWRVRAERHLKAMGPYVVGPVLPYSQSSKWLVRAASLRILGAAGHPAGVVALVRGLTDTVPVVRQVAYENLVAVTGKRIRFDPRASAASRKRAVARWEAYLRSQGLLPPEHDCP